MNHTPTTYQNQLWEALQKSYQAADKSADGTFDYTTFYTNVIQLAQKALPDKDEVKRRYDRLRDEGHFICEDETDVNVYISKVANKHIGKFRALYTHLFENYRDLFSHQVDLIVWGCGCGLDLIAFYETAMQTGTPETWVSVRTITLIDISKAALTRAKECAEMLFPCAKIRPLPCNLKNPDAIATVYATLYERNPFVPRIHFLSNILDLLDRTFVEAFYNKIKSDHQFNEYLIAFSPSYGEVKNRPFEDLKRNLSQFKQEEIRTINSTPIGTGWRFFCRLFNTAFFTHEEEARKEPLLASLRDCIATEPHWSLYCEDYGCLWDYCVRVNRSILSQYQALKRLPIKNSKGEQHYFFLLCPREKGKQFLIMHSPKLFRGKPCASKCSTADSNTCIQRTAFSATFCSKQRTALYVSAEKQIAKEAKIEDSKALESHIYWNIKRPTRPSQQQTMSPQRDTETHAKLLNLFFTDVWGDVKPLLEPKRTIKPSGNSQWDVIYSPRQLRIVRGGPGVGKTFALLWHALYAYKRTHLPVLIVGKTNTLQSINARTLDITLSKYLHSIQKREEIFTVATANEFLCHLQYPRWPQDDKHSACNYNDKLCAQCNQEVYEHPEKYKINKKYGCVLIDEAQALTPEEVSAIYTITKTNNLWREFYLFCDEQQSLRKTNNLTTDTSTGHQKLKVPDRGFGRATILKDNHRLKNHTLLRVCEKVREQMSTRYDTKELTMTLVNEGNARTISAGLLFRSFAISRCPPVSYASEDSSIVGKDNLLSSLKTSFQDLITLENEERNALLCLCNSAKISGFLSQEDIQKQLLCWSSLHNIKITHPVIKEPTASSREKKHLHREQKALKRAFYESDDTLHITMIDCAQGHTFEKVCLVLSDEFELSYLGNLELLFTACSRARTALRVIDATGKHEVYELLKQFN